MFANTPLRKPPPKEDKGVKCQQCQSPMEADRVSKGQGSAFMGLLAMPIGLVLCVVGGLIGVIFGVIMIVGGFSQAFKKKQNIWKCPNCGFFFERIN